MSENESVARVREFILRSPGVLIIQVMGPRGPLKLPMADLEALVVGYDEWKRRAADAAATLGHNRKATDKAGAEVIELRGLMALAYQYGYLPDEVAEKFRQAVPGINAMEVEP